MAEMESTMLVLFALEGGFLLWLALRRPARSDARLLEGARRLGLKSPR